MQVLVVEDDGASVRALEAALAEAGLSVTTTVAGSRAEALERLESSDFDFIVCDLHIPSEPGAEPELDHGLAVYEYASSALGGTPTMLLTGSGDQRAARVRVAGSRSADIFGVGEPYPMTDFIYKDEPQAYVQRIAEIASQLEVLDAIEIQPAAPDLALSAEQARVFRIFARRHHARRVELLALGGLSHALAVRATLFTAERDFVAAVFAKIAPLQEVEVEAGRYQEAALRLPAGSYAPLLDMVTAGAGRYGGLFYGLAERHQDTLFAHILEHPEDAAALAEELQAVLTAWRGSEPEPDDVLVTALRRERISSTDLEPFTAGLGSDWQTFEALRVPVRRSLQHGDLHGANVLVGASTLPLLIDFANVAEYPGCFDPIVLELSLIFHPESPFRSLRWPTVEQCARWWDLETYVDGCPVPAFVRACRAWAMDEATSPVTACAVVYAEALRQLPYARSEAERALAIAGAAAAQALALSEGAEHE